jgi:hypothetical protein
MAQPAKFTHGGRRVEILQSDPYRIIGKYWQFRIDRIHQRDLLFSSARAAALEAENLIDSAEGAPVDRGISGQPEVASVSE